MNPDASGTYRIGCGVTPPIPIRQPEPKYLRQQGKTKLHPTPLITFTVDTGGNPINVHILNPQSDKVAPEERADQQKYEDSMVEAVKQYKFKPAIFRGKPVPVQMNVEINIDLF
jgi:periplasmic protein TonB